MNFDVTTCGDSQVAGEGLAGVLIAVNEADFAGRVAHTGNEAGEVVPVGVGGIAGQRVDAGADGDSLAVQIDVAAACRAAGG